MMSRELTLTWRPLPHQVIPKGGWTVCVLYGGRGVGKTWNGCRWLLTQALTYPNTTWGAIAQTWGDAEKILALGSGGLRWHILGDEATNRPNLEFTLLGGSWATAFRSAPGRMVLRFANGSEIRFASAEKPDSLPPRVLCATTPNGRNWFWQQYLNPEILPLNGLSFVGGADGGVLPPHPPPSSLDNPYTDEAWKKNLLSMYAGTDIGRQEIYGEILTPAGAVFKEISIARHTRARLDMWPKVGEADDVIIGLDLGSENPTAAVVLARSGERWHAVAEAVAPCATPEAVRDLLAPLIEQWSPRVIVADTNYPQTSNSLRKWGMPVQNADKRAGSVLDGIRTVQSHFAADTVAVDEEACPVLWRELLGYRWAVGHDGSPLTPERPVKKDDHTVDALRYAIASVSKPKWSLRLA